MQSDKMKENKETLMKQLEDLQSKEKKMIEDLTTIRSNISGVVGALQYHDFLEKQESEPVKTDKVTVETPMELTPTEEVK